MTTNFRNYHTLRHVSTHVEALDDFLYSSPDLSYKKDRALIDPFEYLNELDKELKLITEAKEDVIYILREFNSTIKLPKSDISLESDAKNYVFHVFTERQFSYGEKIRYLLQDKPAEMINLIYPKAIKQLHVLCHAELDLIVAKYRFEEFVKKVKIRK